MEETSTADFTIFDPSQEDWFLERSFGSLDEREGRGGGGGDLTSTITRVAVDGVFRAIDRGMLTWNQNGLNWTPEALSQGGFGVDLPVSSEQGVLPSLLMGGGGQILQQANKLGKSWIVLAVSSVGLGATAAGIYLADPDSSNWLFAAVPAAGAALESVVRATHEAWKKGFCCFRFCGGGKESSQQVDLLNVEAPRLIKMLPHAIQTKALEKEKKKCLETQKKFSVEWRQNDDGLELWVEGKEGNETDQELTCLLNSFWKNAETKKGMKYLAELYLSNLNIQGTSLSQARSFPRLIKVSFEDCPQLKKDPVLRFIEKTPHLGSIDFSDEHESEISDTFCFQLLQKSFSVECSELGLHEWKSIQSQIVSADSEGDTEDDFGFDELLENQGLSSKEVNLSLQKEGRKIALFIRGTDEEVENPWELEEKLHKVLKQVSRKEGLRRILQEVYFENLPITGEVLSKKRLFHHLKFIGFRDCPHLKKTHLVGICTQQTALTHLDLTGSVNLSKVPQTEKREDGESYEGYIDSDTLIEVIEDSEATDFTRVSTDDGEAMFPQGDVSREFVWKVLSSPYIVYPPSGVDNEAKKEGELAVLYDLLFRRCKTKNDVQMRMDPANAEFFLPYRAALATRTSLLIDAQYLEHFTDVDLLLLVHVLKAYCPQIRAIHLSNCKGVSNTGWSVLAQLVKKCIFLTDLHITGTSSFDDMALVSLGALRKQIRWLDVRGTKVSAAGVAQWEKKKSKEEPECIVVSSAALIQQQDGTVKVLAEHGSKKV